ncbi:MAG TPA: hypothetical protein VG479_10810 [Gaiellaceae bacterium]|jgi:hypothetical protein|nr:hypothetical protein [Gaiellaceae bacterium]
MLRTALLAVTAALTLVACSGKDHAASPPVAQESDADAAPTAAAAPKRTVLASRARREGTELFWANARTLAPVGGHSPVLPYVTSGAVSSPDGKTIALGVGDRGVVQLVTARRLRSLGTVHVGSAFVERLLWVSSDRLLVALGGQPARVAVVDPVSSGMSDKQDLDGITVSSAPAGDALAVLLAPAAGIGPASLAVYDGERLRTASLPGIVAGWREEAVEGEEPRLRQSIPGLAVDPAGDRALVVAAGNRAVEVDLGTMVVREHDLAEPVSLLGRLRDWLEPSAEAKSMDGPERTAVWLPGGLVAVSGAHWTTDGSSIDVTPAGLVLIDPDDWSVSRLGDESSIVTFADGTLVASGYRPGSSEQTLTAFDDGGGWRFSLVRDDADLSQIEGGYLYAAWNNGRRYEVVDLRTGTTVRKVRLARSTWIVPLD